VQLLAVTCLKVVLFSCIENIRPITISLCCLLLENDIRSNYYFIRGENMMVFVSKRLNVSLIMFMLKVILHT
jgi:hypothetical protein